MLRPTLCLFRFVFVISVLIFPAKKSIAWGPEGHAIVGELAMHFVQDDVRKNVMAVLGNMPIDTAANWMDIMKANSDYEFMRPWHYIDFPKNETYTPGADDNIINHLTIAFNELKHKSTLCSDQIKFDVLVIMHLMGDLHMPLHTGYNDDMGGNKIMVQYDTLKTHNLHRFWDEDIIGLGNITYDDCLKLYNNGAINNELTSKVDFVQWMNETRNLLGEVYNYQEFIITKTYFDKNKLVVEKQLLLAALRLADILNRLFPSSAPVINMQQASGEYKNGIDIKDANKNTGKRVTICSRVYGIKTTQNITQIHLGEKYPGNPVTIVVFAKSYINFILPLDEMYSNKNICVTGTLREYQGKQEIIVDIPSDIKIL